MGASVSNKRCDETRSSSSSRHGYSQDCFDYISNYLFPPCSYLNNGKAVDEYSCSTSSEPSHLAPDSQALPSAPILPDAYDDEEEKQFDMAIRESLDVPNSPMASPSLSMICSYTYDVDEEERQINMAIQASLKAPNFLRASSTPSMNPSYGQEWSPRFDNGRSSTSSTSSHSQQPMPSAQQIPNHFRREFLECGICFEVSVPAICDPCGHVCCYECLLQIQGSTNKCPRCRVVITKVMRIYI